MLMELFFSLSHQGVKAMTESISPLYPSPLPSLSPSLSPPLSPSPFLPLPWSRAALAIVYVHGLRLLYEIFINK